MKSQKKVLASGNVSLMDERHLEAAGDRKAQLAEAMRQRIVSMTWAPGCVVDEVALAEEFGLSRPPVRELMRQMAAEGYLELVPNRPARVAPMSFESLRSFFQAAPLIYIATTQLAAIHATVEDIARLKQIQMRFRTAMIGNDTDARVFYNDQFHYEIGNMARNPYLLPSLKRLLIDHARLGKTFYRAPASEDMRKEMSKAVEQHEQIIEAIERHDPDDAATLIRAHWELSRRRMTEYVVPESIDVPLRY